MKKIGIVIIFATIFITIFVSCKSTSTVSTGNYYLDGNKSNEYIQIISDNKMKFVNFDIDYLANYLLSEGTDFEGKEAEDFMKQHNLPNIFNEEIGFDYDKNEKFIYVKALSNENVDYFVVNYRMAYENKNTITFMEHTYTR